MRAVTLREMAVKTVLLLGSLVFILLVLEVILRISLRGDYSVPSDRNWLFQKQWEQRYAQLNSLGHRDHEFSVPKPDGTFRILVLGDSFTFGEGIRNIDDLYTEILERKLNSVGQAQRYQVLNVAHKGWNAAEYLSFLQQQGLSYEPDVILIAFFLNDIEADEMERPKAYPVPESMHRILSRCSYLYWYAYSLYDGWKNKKLWMEYHFSYGSAGSDDWARFERLWSALIQLGVDNEIETAVVILPQLTCLSDDHPFTPIYQNVEQLSRRNGAAVLNLFSAVKGYHPPDLWIGRTDSHPNERAQRIFSEAIYNFLHSQGLLGWSN